MRYEFSKDDLHQALIYYAAKKLGLPFPVQGKAEIQGVWTMLGDGPVVVVNIEHLSNVVHFPKSKK